MATKRTKTARHLAPDAGGAAAAHPVPAEARRYFDERMEALYRQGRLPGAIYSGRGQEGTHVGVVMPLRGDDSLFPTHRDLTAQLAKGLDLKRVMAQFWGRIDGYTRGRDGNSHIGDWQGNRTFTVMSHLPIAYPVACGAALAYQEPGTPRRLGDLRGRRHLERPLARGPQHLGRLPAAGGVGGEQQPVRVLDAEPAGVPGADGRRARRRVRDAGRPGRRRRRPRRLRGRARGGRPGPRGRRALAHRVGVVALARPRGPRPGELHAGRAARALHGRARPGEELRGVHARRGLGHEGRHRRAPGRIERSSTRATSSPSPRRSPSPGTSKGNWIDDGYWASEPGRGGGTED